ncbi:MAG: hypothetical protein SGI71_06885 [Verrucomicrobiota bacterium]|nr:hypothetical protein [Verrucomicrobiota bacterium]
MKCFLVFLLTTLMSLVTPNLFAFDPGLVAKSETNQWKAYYEKQPLLLLVELASTLQNQFGLNEKDAGAVAQLFMHAAMGFRTSSLDKKTIQVELMAGYNIIQKASGLNFDPAEVARAEFAWWIARRTPGQDSSEQIGRLISDLYKTIYGKSNPDIIHAAMKRAEAAHVRDSSASKGQTDWVTVEKLLVESYTSLKKGTAAL